VSAALDIAAAAQAAAASLGVSSEDRVLVLFNARQRAIAEALADASRSHTSDVLQLEYGTLSRNGEEPPASVAAAMLEVARELNDQAQLTARHAAVRTSRTIPARSSASQITTTLCDLFELRTTQRCR
jgi:hypothetical protein